MILNVFIPVQKQLSKHSILCTIDNVVEALLHNSICIMLFKCEKCFPCLDVILTTTMYDTVIPIVQLRLREHELSKNIYEVHGRRLILTRKVPIIVPVLNQGFFHAKKGL